MESHSLPRGSNPRGLHSSQWSSQQANALHRSMLECVDLRRHNAFLRDHAITLELQKISHAEEIGSLQRKLTELEAENAKLKAGSLLVCDTPTAQAVGPLPQELPASNSALGIPKRGAAQDIRPVAATQATFGTDLRQSALGPRPGIDGSMASSGINRSAAGNAFFATQELCRSEPSSTPQANYPGQCPAAGGVSASTKAVAQAETTSIKYPRMAPGSAVEGTLASGSYRVWSPQARPDSGASLPLSRGATLKCNSVECANTSGPALVPDVSSDPAYRFPTPDSSSGLAGGLASVHPLGDFWTGICSAPMNNTGLGVPPGVAIAAARESARSPTSTLSSGCPKQLKAPRRSSIDSTSDRDIGADSLQPPDGHRLVQETKRSWAFPGSGPEQSLLRGPFQTDVLPIAPTAERQTSGTAKQPDGASSRDGQVMDEKAKEGEEAYDEEESAAQRGPFQTDVVLPIAPTAERQISGTAMQQDGGSSRDGQVTAEETEAREKASDEASAAALVGEGDPTVIVAGKEPQMVTILRCTWMEGMDTQSRCSHVSVCTFCHESPQDGTPVGLCQRCPRMFCFKCLQEGVQKDEVIFEGVNSDFVTLLNESRGDVCVRECPQCQCNGDCEFKPPPDGVPLMNHLLEELLRHDLSYSFRLPGDLVRHPHRESVGRAGMMDLNTMMGKLRDRKYPRRRGPGQFQEDLRRIWRDCRKFAGCDELGQPLKGTTTPGIVRCALILEAMSEKFFAAHMSDQEVTLWPESAWDCYRQRKQQEVAEKRLSQLKRRDTATKAESPTCAKGGGGSGLVTLPERSPCSSIESSVNGARGKQSPTRASAYAGSKMALVAAEGSITGGRNGRKRHKTVLGTPLYGSGVSPMVRSGPTGGRQQSESSLLEKLCDVATSYYAQQSRKF